MAALPPLVTPGAASRLTPRLRVGDLGDASQGLGGASLLSSRGPALSVDLEAGVRSSASSARRRGDTRDDDASVRMAKLLLIQQGRTQREEMHALSPSRR